MREILFRGKRKDNGEWIEGYFVHTKSIYDTEEEREADIIPHDADRVYTGEYNYAYPCIPETVGQYTGLTDKNGQKIFENDIVIDDYYFEKDKTKNSIIRYGQWNCTCCNGVFGWVSEGYADFRDEDVTVIGNVFDNPELLGDK